MALYATSTPLLILITLICKINDNFCFVILDNPPESKTKIEVPPIIISSKLGETIRIDLPKFNIVNSYTYLYEPNGKIVSLNANKEIDSNTNNKEIHIIDESKTNITYLNEAILIGPLQVKDYGNWVISTFTKDINDKWVEMFQVITVEITEHIESPSRTLKQGDTFQLHFPRALHTNTCQLIAPITACDRRYDRDKMYEESCGFLVKNVDKNDEGCWTILGVGDVVYKTDVCLVVK